MVTGFMKVSDSWCELWCEFREVLHCRGVMFRCIGMELVGEERVAAAVHTIGRW